MEIRHGSAGALVVALWALVWLGGCALLPPASLYPQPKPRQKPATKVIGSTGPVSAVKSAAIVVHATKANGAAAGNVLVLLYALDAKPEPDDAPAVLDILDRRFEPRVLAVRVGDSVRLENLDGVPHDVYSFSKARPLSLHLAAGERGVKLKFPRAGVVALGSKIYSDMRGYIYVSDAAYFGRTDCNGFLRLSGLVPGSYRINVWRADRAETDPQKFPRKVELEPGAEEALPVGFQTTPIAAGTHATPSRTQPKTGRD